MKCLFFNYDTNKLITEVQLNKINCRLQDFTDIIWEKQKTEDILGLGKPCKLARDGFGLGIRQYTHGNGYMTSINSKEKMELIGKINCLMTGNNSYIFGQNEKEITPPDYVCYYDDNNEKQTSSLRIGIFAYPEGYIISTGKVSHGIFGNESKMYFEKITSRNFKCKGKEFCKKFSTLKSMLKYIKDHKDVFEYMVKKYGYVFDWEYASSEFETDINNNSEKVKKSELLAKTELDELIIAINSCDEDEVDNLSLPTYSIADKDNIIQEALQRMSSLQLMGAVTKNFRTGTLMQSEFGGILYDLDENAKIAVNEIIKKGLTPYHVIVGNTSLGKMYTVLYVGPNTTEWNAERPDKNGCVAAYVYNSTEPLFSEFGDVCISSANGGLVRTA